MVIFQVNFCTVELQMAALNALSLFIISLSASLLYLNFEWNFVLWLLCDKHF